MSIQLPKWLQWLKWPKRRNYPCTTITIHAGSHLDGTVCEAIVQAKVQRTLIKFDFNDVVVTVAPDSDPKLIIRDWWRALHGCIDKEVGPYPKPELSAEEKANDARIEAENERRREAERARWRAEEDEKRRRVEARMASAPAMEFSDEEGWNQTRAANADSYDSGILDYAERWARMMQLELAEGKTLAEVWEQTSFDADLEGMSGATQGMATHILTQCWVHGAELRRLHNAYWGVSDTSGTVNPAVINIGGND